MMTELEFYGFMVIFGIGYYIGFTVAAWRKPYGEIQIESEWNDHG